MKDENNDNEFINSSDDDDSKENNKENNDGSKKGEQKGEKGKGGTSYDGCDGGNTNDASEKHTYAVENLSLPQSKKIKRLKTNATTVQLSDGSYVTQVTAMSLGGTSWKE